jgi:lipoate---protein ligase
MHWQILDTGIAAAERNMQLDAIFLESLNSFQHGILHFYDWMGDSATYGYFTDPFKFLNPQGVQKHNLQLAKRPTGGGIIFHQFDLAFSFLMPAGHPGFSVNTLQNYEYVNQIVAQALKRFSGSNLLPELLVEETVISNLNSKHFCMAKPTIYDVMIDGRKIGGGAQRRTKHGLLHQGSICLTLPSDSYLSEILLPETCVIDSMRRHSYLLLGLSATEKQLNEARQELRQLLIESALSIN